MSNRILVNPGTEQAWEITLRPGVNRIGCSPENDFIINHPSISPQHCELLVSESGVWLKDLGSKSGTFVDRSTVSEIKLQAGQHIQIGAIDTIFESAPAATTSSPVNQPAPGATIIVAAFGSPSGVESSAPVNPPIEAKSDVPGEQPASGPRERSEGSKRFPVHFAAEREADRKKRFILGVAGALTGSLIGVFLWFLLIKSTGSPLLVMAWGVGGLTGLGAFLLTKHGGLPLGVAAAICALVGIVTGNCLAAKAVRAEEATRRATVAYRSQLEFAKESLRADSPEEFRKVLAQLTGTTAEEVTDDQIKTFQDQELPTLRDFALGKPSKDEFTQEMESKFVDQFDYKEFLFKDDPRSGLFMVLFAVLSIVTAYKVGSGKSDDQPEAARD